MQKFCHIYLIIFMTSCVSYPEAIENVLLQAGSNRKEIEKVLKHYSHSPADSLKLRAAEFLIVNMPGKYSEYYDAPWNDVATVHLRWTSSSDKQMVLDTYKLGKPVKKDDVTHITAKYLINNIELAFEVWQIQPWGKDIPFDVFCEEILPYRVGNEPLENWREKVLASFADIYKEMREDPAMTTVQACRKANRRLPRFRLDKDFPNMNYSQLMASTRGMCDSWATLAIFVMRGLGIPVTFDYTPKWIGFPNGHSWNSVRDNITGTHISFMGAQSDPGEVHQGTTLVKAKAYRQLYGRQQNVKLEITDIPPLLHNINHITDITSETEYCTDISLPLPENHLNQKGHIFLAIHGEMEWQPIAWGFVTPNGLEFHSVKSGLYLPVYYHNGTQSPAGYPFRIENDSCRFFQPCSSYPRSFTSIVPNDSVKSYIMDGKFEVANRRDFSDARTIHTIGRVNPYYNVANVNCSSTCRYIRYVPSNSEYCNVSILEFYNENNEKLQGTVIGTSGDDSKVFDDDVDTFFEAASDTSWVGLDFREPRQITKIRFLPRTNGNGIYEGHVYELLYWNGDKWYSLGRKTATSHVLQYNVPDNALLILKNLTKNRMYKTPFFIESDTQQWFQSN